MTEAVPQQFVTDEGETQVDGATNEQVQGGDPQTTGAEGEATSRRGRPRSQDAMNRDEAVFNTLNDGAQLTRNEIAEQVGFTGGLTYLSLYRLQREGRVTRVSDGTTRRAWRQTTAEDAQPVAESGEEPVAPTED